MDGSFTYQQIKGLQQLFSTNDGADSDSEDEDLRQHANLSRKFGPGDIGKLGGQTDKNVPKAKDDRIIWQKYEAKDAIDHDIDDPREVPEYEIKFKQDVGTEDVFLGMNLKTPSTSSCEWLTVLIKLPSETQDKIQLSVESDVIDLRSPRYRLHLPTPHAVDPNSSSAKWHPDRQCLEISLKLTRELDLVNF